MLTSRIFLACAAATAILFAWGVIWTFWYPKRNLAIIIATILITVGTVVVDRIYPMPTQPPPVIVWRTNERIQLPPEKLHVDDQIKIGVERPSNPNRARANMDVGIRFFMSGPQKQLSISFVNRSDSLVRDIRWAMVLWNTRLNQDTSIPIFTYPINWIKAHEEGAHAELFQQNPPPQINIGDELIGTAALDCPTCAPITYVVDVIWGDHGWYGESRTQFKGKLVVPQKSMGSSEARAAYFKQVVNLIPQENRIAMTDQ